MNNIFRKLRLKRRMITAFAALHFYGNPSTKLKIIGVTGTNGKTTTATLLYRIAIILGYKAGLIGTVENLVNGHRMEATHTTPDPVALNRLLSKMVEAGCVYVFMEVSSHALDQGRVAGITFSGGIFTNLTHDHIDYHKSFVNYFNAKKKFFKMLPEHAFALSNTDDGHGELMMSNIKAQKNSYGFNNLVVGVPSGTPTTKFQDFHGEIEKIDFNGLKLNFNGEEVESKMQGKFNAYNLLGVWSACKLLGFDMQKVNKILENIEPPAGRFQPYVSPSGVLVIVDYAHTPDALENVFNAIRTSFVGARIISVFGCGGDRDPLKRRIMGKIGAEMSDIAIFTSDNPRSENPESIIAEMNTDLSMSLAEKVKSIANRREAILESVKLAKSGDIILCAGKGHEDYQEIKGVKHHFNDMEEYKKVYE